MISIEVKVFLMRKKNTRQELAKEGNMRKRGREGEKEGAGRGGGREREDREGEREGEIAIQVSSSLSRISSSVRRLILFGQSLFFLLCPTAPHAEHVTFDSTSLKRTSLK